MKKSWVTKASGKLACRKAGALLGEHPLGPEGDREGGNIKAFHQYLRQSGWGSPEEWQGREQGLRLLGKVVICCQVWGGGP